MGKSEFKQIVSKYAGGCMTQSDAQVVICDALVNLRTWGHIVAGRYTKPVGLSDVVYDIFRPVLLKYPRCKCFVFVFDKQKYVTLAKQHEQMSRDGNVAPMAKQAIPEKAVGLTWAKFVADRGMRQVLISAVGDKAVELFPGLLLQMRRKADVVLDYQRIDGDVHEARLEVLTADSVLRHVAQTGFENTLGEFDVAFPHYVYHPWFDGLRVAIDSVDTDMLPIAMLHAAHRPLRCELYCVLPCSKVPTWFHVGRCVQGFASSLNKSEVAAAQIICELYIHAGSDFVEACPGVSCEVFIDDYLCNYQKLSSTEYKQQLANSSLQKLSGVRQASKGAKAKREAIDVHMSSKRVEYTINYWLHSTFEPHALIRSPVGYGFSLVAGKVVPTELVGNKRQKR